MKLPPESQLLLPQARLGGLGSTAAVLLFAPNCSKDGVAAHLWQALDLKPVPDLLRNLLVEQLRDALWPESICCAFTGSIQSLSVRVILLP
jgi:hypothetical protein